MILGDVARRARGNFQILDGNVVGVSVAGFGIREHPHPYPIGGRLRAVLDQSFLQADTFVPAVFKVEVGVIGPFAQSFLQDFI
jgi:hypothetical protein